MCEGKRKKTFLLVEGPQSLSDLSENLRKCELCVEFKSVPTDREEFSLIDMDPSYEFDAPKYYDFKRTDDGVSMASRWFDEQEGELVDPAPLSFFRA